jgi:hypothetical protein
MARAYPSFKDELNEALADNQVGTVGKAMLQNIKFLCEFAIPAVSHMRVMHIWFFVSVFEL